MAASLARPKPGVTGYWRKRKTSGGGALQMHKAPSHLLWESDAASQLRKAWLGTERVKHRLNVEQYQDHISFLERPFEQLESLRFVTQRAIDRRHHTRRYLFARRQALQFLKYLSGFVSPSRERIG